ncbi:hypothetical protein CFIO01_00643 [Colletotrichum fioriniae PJ7]|uniref:Uncharacterized protein n=1 Tax=Colletotrichum fioriniae PJ7 TaxID=1445577 RepID=A0A010RVG5_9PEZI|nr:hypothetical protein CFIO01_00643 [Colletotrichum fioriniae PJ7]
MSHQALHQQPKNQTDVVSIERIKAPTSMSPRQCLEYLESVWKQDEPPSVYSNERLRQLLQEPLEVIVKQIDNRQTDVLEKWLHEDCHFIEECSDNLNAGTGKILRSGSKKEAISLFSKKNETRSERSVVIDTLVDHCNITCVYEATVEIEGRKDGKWVQNQPNKFYSAALYLEIDNDFKIIKMKYRHTDEVPSNLSMKDLVIAEAKLKRDRKASAAMAAYGDAIMLLR